MGKTRAIAIGINQYHNFQPLRYAQHDARVFYDFFTYQAGLSNNPCWLLGDVSPPIDGTSTYPERATLENWIDRLGSDRNFALASDDVLWFFFSGYGCSIDGQDYLMPIDGDPNQVTSTGIAIEWVLHSLKSLPTQNLLVVLDINRASSLQIGGLLGNQTVNLAREWQIPTLLSCQPGQFSQETLELRQGLFTAALLEGLRSGQCSTLASLDAYLQRRLVELSDRHNRPNQQALMVVNPPSQVHRVILPAEDDLILDRELEEMASDAAPGANASTISQPPPIPQTTSTQISKPMEPDKQPQSQDPKSNDEDAQFWRLLILAWGGIALILIGGVFLRNRTAFTAADGNPTPPGPEATPSEVVVIPAPAPAGEPVNPEPVAANPEPVAVNPEIPPVPTAPLVAEVVEAPPAPTLAGVSRVLGSQQASLYLKAIEEAQQISPDDPLYSEAQGKIELWSQAILDIATGRAAQGKFTNAIAAANLVPEEVSVYAEAQSAIALWQQQGAQSTANYQIIQNAKSKIKPDQASLYNQAIAEVMAIPPDQPQAAQAQKLANQWSSEILKIAYRRLPKQGPAAAISVAQLVPKNTAAYTEAQQAIAVWKTRS
ncbi:caspase family protein [Roseofilum casamattae]|uniref:Caspase family protein n=1 Tax=Roseofilum casamattae BLCC-M143 TaxID=3022442 RepID=A0ABT7BWK3_9CYAN|nr:caspase family protein [Roseofilum casamattae]MDJ1183582.1 caspase family protein [Roseofilum casamattae BLCC-M143]